MLGFLVQPYYLVHNLIIDIFRNGEEPFPALIAPRLLKNSIYFHISLKSALQVGPLNFLF